MSPRAERWCVRLFLAAALALFGWQGMRKPAILVLHSYDPGYAWVRDVNIGLQRALAQRYLYRIHWHYMDTKRHPDEDYQRSAGIAARKLIEATRPDLVIAIDDDAQRLVARHFIGGGGPAIVFAGVNRDAAEYGYDRAGNVTGILERLPLDALLDMLRSAGNLAPPGRAMRLAVLGDLSGTVSGDMRQVRAFDWRPARLSAIVQVGTWPEWQARVAALGRGSDVLVVAGYRRLARSATDRALVPPAEVVAWTEAHSPVPVVSFNGFHIEDGGMLAIGASPYEQGEVAATLALDILLRGKSPASLPVVQSRQFVVGMRGGRMRARGFTLPRIYEAAARTGGTYVP